MKNVLITLLTLFLILPLNAQEASEESPQKLGLQFRLSGLNLGSINGGIGFNYYSTPQSEWLFGVKFNKIDDEESRGDFSRESNLVGANIGYNLHLKSAKKLSPYLGVLVGLAQQNSDYNRNSNDPQFSYTDKQHSLVYSGALIFGVRYKFAKSFSVAGQYQINAELEKQTYERTGFDPIEKSKNTSTAYDISSAGIILTIHL